LYFLIYIQYFIFLGRKRSGEEIGWKIDGAEVAVRACRVTAPELLNHRGAAIVLTFAYSSPCAEAGADRAHDHEEHRRGRHQS
jgi:hypothetical protein